MSALRKVWVVNAVGDSAVNAEKRKQKAKLELTQKNEPSSAVASLLGRVFTTHTTLGFAK